MGKHGPQEGQSPPDSHTISHLCLSTCTNSYRSFQALLGHPLSSDHAELISITSDPLPWNKGCLGPALPASQEAPQAGAQAKAFGEPECPERSHWYVQRSRESEDLQI